MKELFDNVYRGRKVLVTGNTGFKGAWLSLWLRMLGAEVVGLAREIPTTPSFFEVTGQPQERANHWGDLRNPNFVVEVVKAVAPDFVFHLAAQALVRKAYATPLETLETNVLGTAYLLDALRQCVKPCTAVLITSDKAYDNVEWTWGYRENDALGGKDPYSASKGAAELIIKTYVHSYFSAPDSLVRVASTRAGNVIGGGDWAADRIVPDLMRAWARDEKVEIRSPRATRPWQHVLEPLSGYLHLGARLSAERTLHGEAFNFGPKAENNFSVAELIAEIQKSWAGPGWIDRSAAMVGQHEAQLLKLNCDKALHRLSWFPTLTFTETVALTADWYREYYGGSGTMADFSQAQIEQYQRLASERGQVWCRE